LPQDQIAKKFICFGVDGALKNFAHCWHFQWNSNMIAFTCGGYLIWILEFNIWHFSWMANMVGHCIEIWRPYCHHLWWIVYLWLWSCVCCWIFGEKLVQRKKLTTICASKFIFFSIFNFFCVFFSSFQVFVFMQIHELCVFWQGLDKLWFENQKLCF
jgi:hypothetical protein